MTWVVRLPQRADFCGVVGCPLCFAWADEKGAPLDVDGSVLQFATTLLARAATPAELEEAKKAAIALHQKGLNKQLYPEEPPSVSDGVVDIGMSSVRRQQAFFKQFSRQKAVAPRQLTCDEVAAIQYEREREAAKKEAAAAAKQKEMKELMQQFRNATAQTAGIPGMDSAATYELQKAGVPTVFIYECMQQGTYDPYIIYREYMRYTATPSMSMSSVTSAPMQYDLPGRIR